MQVKACEAGEEKEMKVNTQPSCRVGSEGQTLHYVVSAQGASELSVGEGCPDTLKVRVVETRQVGDGLEADLEVQVLDATPY